ncbi:MAG: hypothetical protein ACOH2S_26970 [Janthinobacterium svalbardensis]
MSAAPKEKKVKINGNFAIDRDNFMVSERSNWHDYIWHLESNTKGQRNFIGWRFQLPDGLWSTDVMHSLLLEGFREVCWGMLTGTGTYNKKLSVGSLASMGTGIRELFRWMVKRGLRNFSQLDATAHQHYLLDIPLILVAPEKFYESSMIKNELSENLYIDELRNLAEEFDGIERIDLLSDGNSESPLIYDDFPLAEQAEDQFTYNQVSVRIKTLYYLYSQKSVLEHTGIVPMKFKPFPGKSSGDVVSQVVKYVINRIPPLPDEVATPLLKEALDWIYYKADDVLTLQELFLSTKSALIIKGLNKKTTGNLLNSLLENFVFCCKPGESTSWRPSLEIENVIHPEHGEVSLNRIQGLRRMIMSLRDACIIIIQYMVGLRANEICAIESGWNSKENLPSCIIKKFSKSGVMEMFFLKSILSKGVENPISEEWLLGCRPVGSTFLPAPICALEVLEKLFRPWRLLAERKSLIVSFSQPKGLPLQTSSISNFSTAELLRGLRHFTYSHVDLSSIPDRSKRNEDLTFYRSTKGLCIRSHQGRKTFSAFILETRASLLKAVSQHFKHYNIAVTQGAYFPKSSQLHSEMQSVAFSESVAFFAEATKGKIMAGRMAPIIAEAFKSDEWQNIDGYAELEQKITDLVRTHDLRIFFNDYGNCFIAANPLASRCHQASGSMHWSSISPNYSVRSPSICSGCGAFSIDASHLPFWKNLETELLSVVQGATLDGKSREFFVLEKRLNQARKIIEIIKEPVNDKG